MKKKTELRTLKRFSEELKKEIVVQIERGIISVAEAKREYSIGGTQTVYNWLYKYSRNLKKGTRIVMEKNSQEFNKQELLKRIKELEAALGRKSLEADLYRHIVDLASEEYKTDLKKNFGVKASPGTKP